MRATLLAAFAVLAAAAPAGAAEIAVDSTAPGLGNCAVPGSCTLRQALADAKTLPGRDTIRVPPGTYDQTGPDLIVSIGEQVDIVGQDPRTTVIREVSGGDGRVFLVEVRNELKKVTWPLRKEVYAATVVVILFSFILGTFLWIVDLILERGVFALFQRFR